MGRKTKILGIITIVALLLGGVVVPVAAQPAVTVSIDAPTEAAAGSDFTANVNITEVTDFDACNYNVSFDASVLRLDSVSSGLIDSTTIPVDVANEISSGTWTIVQNVPGLTGASGSGYLAVLHFTVIGAEGTSSTISLSNGILGDTLGEEITATWTGDSVSVPDATAPTVSSVSPVADATGVAIGTTVSVTFSEAMASATITTSSFTLDSVAGSVSYDIGTYTATFTPGADLAYSTTYTATLSTAITDAPGNPLASAYSWSFTTVSTPPEGVIVSIDAPTEAATGSDFTANVNITEVTDFDACNYDVSFDASVLELISVSSGLIDSTTIPVDIANEISSGTWTIVQNVPGLTGASGSGYLAVLHFTVIGAEGTSSTISLSNGILGDTLGEEITATWVGDSVSITDTIPPTVSSVSPLDGATGVAVGTTVSVTFGEAMAASTITTGSFTLDSVSGSVSYNSGTYTATFTPGADLAYSTTYTATLSTAITDAAGNPLSSAYSWSFTTVSVPPEEVTVSIDAPPEAATGSDFTANVNITEVVGFDACNYDVSFDASVLELTSVTSGLIGSTTIPVDIANEISSGTWSIVQNVPGLTGVSGSGYLAVLHFTVIGAEGTSSTISLSNGILGNTLGEEITATWTGDSVSVLAVDTTPPTVSSVSPLDGATSVAIGTTVSVTFGEAMDVSTITTGSFTLDSVSGSVSYDIGTYTAIFTPGANLAYSTTYTATLSTAITDISGNPLASAYSWSFTTRSRPAGGGGGGIGGRDRTPPRISDVSVSNITRTGADINWKTHEKSDSQVEYWASPSKKTTLDEERALIHLVSLTDLTPGTTQYFRVMSADRAGNQAVSGEHVFNTLGAPPAANFTSSKLSISPSEVNIGETVTISVLITNTGDAAGSYKVTLKINGVEEATRDITLNAGASKEVTFTTTAKDVAGSYTVDADGLSGAFTVKEKPAPPPTPTPTPTPTPIPIPSPEPVVNWPLIWGIIGGVVVVGVIIFLVVRKRRV